MGIFFIKIRYQSPFSSNKINSNIQSEKNATRYLIFHPFLTEEGGLIFQDRSPLIKIDKNSQLVWQNQEDEFHHSIEQDHEGNLWVPSEIYPYQVDKKYVGSKWDTYKDDAITKVSADGKILFQKSVSNILIENNLKSLLFQLYPFLINLNMVSIRAIHLLCQIHFLYTRQMEMLDRTYYTNWPKRCRLSFVKLN